MFPGRLAVGQKRRRSHNVGMYIQFPSAKVDEPGTVEAALNQTSTITNRLSGRC
jgi:8-oxo-dGTP pyrophosphatase MutT (NUDIX family)